MSGAAHHLVIGRAAEDAACRYLEGRGYRVVARNLRFRRGELDIVALDAGVLALVEVRYRSRQDYGGAGGSITAAKRASLVRAARTLLARRPELARLPARFDVVEVTGEARALDCRLLRAAFSL